MANYPQTTPTQFTGDLVLTEGGRIGIGTNVLTDLLTLKAVNAHAQIKIDNNWAPGIELATDGIQYWSIYDWVDNGHRLFLEKTPDPKTFVLVLEQDGDIGVGAMRPHSRLQVQSDQTSGTGTVSSSGTTVTDNGTAFTSELAVGDELFAGNQCRVVASIAGDTSLTVDETYSPNLSNESFKHSRPRLVVKQDGKIGVCTPYPQVELDVNGTVRAKEYQGLPENDVVIEAPQNQEVVIKTQTEGKAVRIDSAGDVRISMPDSRFVVDDGGVVTPTALMQIQGPRRPNVGNVLIGPGDINGVDGRLEVRSPSGVDMLSVVHVQSAGKLATVLRSIGGQIMVIPQTMNSAGIQAAIEYANSFAPAPKPPVFLPAGNYDIDSQITLYSFMTLMGAGIEATRLNVTTLDDDVIVSALQGTETLVARVVLRDFRIRGPLDTAQRHTGILLQGAVVEASVENVYVARCRKGIHIRGWVNTNAFRKIGAGTVS
jgi:hypothetical protein